MTATIQIWIMAYAKKMTGKAAKLPTSGTPTEIASAARKLYGPNLIAASVYRYGEGDQLEIRTRGLDYTGRPIMKRVACYSPDAR